MAAEFDRVRIDTVEVPVEIARRALADMDPELRRALERTKRNLEAVQRAFLPVMEETSPEPGIVVGRRPDPLDRVGVYAPGGRAAYPSSVLMGAVPARVAGVREVVLCSPPGPDGFPSSVVLAAAALSDVDRIFAIGGAGAIAAMAYGTESVPRVDRIVGPGNAYVAEAKLQVGGMVAIDSPAGPSELLVVADGTADVEVVVREVMAQAEHDPRAVVVVVAIGEAVAARIASAIEGAMDAEPRAAIIRESLRDRGAVLVADSLEECATFAARFAPEHLLLAMDDARAALPRFRNAGTIFVGARSSVAFGDYMTGANHVLPTGGLARSYSGLSVLDFIRWTTYQEVSAEGAARLASDVGIFADAEGLPAHAATARQWQRAGAGAGAAS
jgi:histidinol dehydrogenase